MVYLLVEFCQYLLPEITHHGPVHDVTVTDNNANMECIVHGSTVQFASKKYTYF